MQKGGLYEVVTQMEPRPFPRELFLGKDGAGKTVVPFTERLGKLPQLREGDGRNNHMASVLGTMLRTATVKEFSNVYGAFRELNRTMAQPLSDRELEAIWKSISAREAAKKGEAEDIEFDCNEKSGRPYPNIANVRRR